jgi:ABC-type multidrug transport system ATPase subunit
MLEARALTKRYTTTTAVDDVSFTVKPYDVLGATSARNRR